MTTGYWKLVHENQDFRNLWFGQIVSLFGDWFNLIASASLVASLTHSGLAVGGLFAVRMLAPFAVSPLAGVAADRYDRRKLLLLTDFVRAAVVLGFLFVRRPEHLWLLYVLTAVQLAMHGVFFPTRNAILPDIVSPPELGAANALTATTWSVMLAVGAGAGGLVAGGFGLYPAFVIDSVTFLISAFFIIKVRYQKPNRTLGTSNVREALREYRDGLRYLFAHRDVLAIALHKGALTFFVAGAYEVTQVAIAKDVFVIGEGGGIGLGLLYAAIGFGSGVGPIVTRSITGDSDRPMRVAMVLCYVTMSMGLALMAPLASLHWALAGAFVRAAGGGTLWVLSTQLLLQTVPEKVRGRVFSTEYALLTLAMATSAAMGGLALDSGLLSLSQLLGFLAAVVLAPGLLWALWVSRSGPKPGNHDASGHDSRA